MGSLLQAILFDIDDTLFDRRQAQERMAELIARESGALLAGVDERAIRDAFLESDRISAQQYDWTGDIDAARLGRSRIFLGLLGVDQGAAQDITELYVDRYPRIAAVMQGARPVLERLSSQFKLGVVSNGMPDVQYQKIETLGIRHLLACILLPDEMGVGKPDPRIFWQAAEALAVAPQACLYVGDSYEVDVVGARWAGMRTCWFNPDGLPLPDPVTPPDLEVRVLAEIHQKLDHLQLPCR